jgi:endonuclease/exonuclease/phosphatase family metal-dependent hydrolase
MTSSTLGWFIPSALIFPISMALVACTPESLSPSDESFDDVAPLLVDTRVRLMTANISSGNRQSYDPGEGIRIFQSAGPDIVMIQEFNYRTNSAADIRSFVDTAFGPAFAYHREDGVQIPNGIISRWPIIASGEWDDTSVANRDFVWARIDIPGPVDLWAISVHLLTSSAVLRDAEANQLVYLIKQKIPAGDFMVIGGDLNTRNRGETAITTLSQVVVTEGPYPADRNNNTNTNISRSSPYDWLLADDDLNLHKSSVKIGESAFPSGLVADTRVYSPIAELRPALPTDSGATNMQHMGVIRDFLIPGARKSTATLSIPVVGENS